MDQSAFSQLRGFEGDDARREAVRAFGTKLLTANVCSTVKASEVAECLESLPFSARTEFTMNVIAKSPARDAIVASLFDFCFEAATEGEGEEGGDGEAEAEFIVIAGGGTDGSGRKNLNPSKFAVMKQVVLLAPLCGEKGVELFRRYLSSPSSRYLCAFAQGMVKSPSLSDEELLSLFVNSVESVRDVIVKESRKEKHRGKFLDALLKKGLVPTGNVFFIPPTSILARLQGKETNPDKAAVLGEGLQNWQVNGEAYIEYLEGVLKPLAKDPLAAGKALREFEKKVWAEVGSVNASKLFAIYENSHAREIETQAKSISTPMTNWLTSASKRGDMTDPSIEFPKVSFVLPPSGIRNQMRPEEKLKVVKYVFDQTPHGFCVKRQKKNHLPLVKEFFLRRKKIPGQTAKEFQGLIFDAFKSVSPEIFWAALGEMPKDLDLTEKQSESLEAFLLFKKRAEETFSSGLKRLKESLPLVVAWLEMHERMGAGLKLPEGAPGESAAQEKAKEELRRRFKLWLASSFQALVPLVQGIANKAERAAVECNSRAVQTPLTSYAGALELVLEDVGGFLLKAFEKAMSTSEPFLPLTELCENALLLASCCSPSLLESGGECATVKRVSALCEGLRLKAIGALDTVLVFDPSKGNGELYVTERIMRAASSMMPKLFGEGQVLSRPATLQDRLLSFASDLIVRSDLSLEQKRQGFEAVKQKDGQRVVFKTYDLNRHQEARTLSTTLLRQLLSELARAADEEEENRRKGKQMHVKASDPPVLARREKAWGLYRKWKYEKTHEEASRSPPWVPSDPGELGPYLSEIPLLPGPVAAREIPTIQAAARARIRKAKQKGSSISLSDFFEPLRRNDMLKGLLDALTPSELSQKTRLSQLAAAGCVGDPEVREEMNAACQGRDPEARMANLCVLLTKSTSTTALADPLNEYAVSLSYVAKRIRNEAGLYRPTVYACIRSQISLSVGLSLSAEGNAEVPKHVQTVTQALEKMLSDDVSKRDSVAKKTFQQIAEDMIRVALQTKTRADLLPVRRLWVESAVRLEHTVLRTIGGSAGIEAYVWPINGLVLPSNPLISEQTLSAPLRNFLFEEVRNGTNIWRELRKQAFRSGTVVAEAGAEKKSETALTPEEAVEILLSAVVHSLETPDELQLEPTTASALQQGGTRAPAWPDVDPKGLLDVLAEGDLFPTAPSKSSSEESLPLRRLLALVRLLGPLWTRKKSNPVGLLVDRVTVSLERETAVIREKKESQITPPPSFLNHLKQVRILFDALIKASGSIDWFLIPRLGRLIEALIEASLCVKDVKTLNSLLPQWTQKRLREREWKNCQLSSSTPEGVTESDCLFLLSKASGSLRASLLSRRTAAEAEGTEGIVGDLLKKTPSAIHYAEVQKFLLSRRDELLTRYLGQKKAAFWGVFDPAFDAADPSAPPPGDHQKESFLLALSSAQMSNLTSKCATVLSRCVLANAMNPSLSVTMRTAKLTQFLESPSVGAGEVISLLRELIRQDQQAEGQDSSVHALMESVVLSVFRTDASWQVLAFLFSPEVIPVIPQRTTGALLTNLSVYIPVEKAVKVLEVLLQPPRRARLSLVLQKQIMRMLFEAAPESESAMSLFEKEWRARKTLKTSPDVVHDMLTLSARGVGKMAASTEEEIRGYEKFRASRLKAQYEKTWAIVNEAASDGSLPVDSAALLFGPSWIPPMKPPFPEGAGGSCDAVFRQCVSAHASAGAGAGAELDEELRGFRDLCSKTQAETPVNFSPKTSCPPFRKMLALLRGARKEEEPLRLLAWCKELLFSPAVAGEEDGECVRVLKEEVKKQTEKETPLKAADAFALQFSATLLGEITYTAVAARVATGKVTQADDLQKAAEEFEACRAFKTLFKEVAMKFATTPPVQVNVRKRLAGGLRHLQQGVCGAQGVGAKASWRARLFEALATKPCKELIELLQEDAELMGATGLCSGSSSSRRGSSQSKKGGVDSDWSLTVEVYQRVGVHTIQSLQDLIDLLD